MQTSDCLNEMLNLMRGCTQICYVRNYQLIMVGPPLTEILDPTPGIISVRNETCHFVNPEHLLQLQSGWRLNFVV